MAWVNTDCHFWTNTTHLAGNRGVLQTARTHEGTEKARVSQKAKKNFKSEIKEYSKNILKKLAKRKSQTRKER